METDRTNTTMEDKARALALGLARAEKALQDFTAGQVDAVVDPSGKTYLLREAQEHLRQKEKRLQEVIDAGADVITVVNRGGAILSQSQAVRKVLGYEPDELAGHSIFNFIHPRDMSAVFSAFINVVEGFRDTGDAHFRHRLRDGSYRSVSATLSKFRDASSSIVVFSLRPVAGYSFNNRLDENEADPELMRPSVTKSKAPGVATPNFNAGRELPSGEKKLHARDFFDSFPDFLVLDAQGLVQRESPTLPRLLGHDSETLIGRCVFEFVHPDDLPSFRALLSEAIKQDAPTTFDAQFRHRMPDGSWSRIEATVGTLQPIAPTEIILIFREAAQSREERERAVLREVTFAKASLAKDKFLAMLSHELLTPLSPVLLCLTELEEDERYAEARPSFQLIRRNLDMQVRLLEELSYFTAVDQHKVRLKLELIDAHDAVRFVVEICRSEIAKARIKVLLDLRAAENIVLADAVRLQQVLWNLLKNAVKFSPLGGSISITSENDSAGRLRLSFADHGIGIRPELLPLVFDPFQQENGATRPHHGGLGLGLFIAKGLAEAQQATLAVESAGEGKGATFRLSFQTATPTGRTREATTAS